MTISPWHSIFMTFFMATVSGVTVFL